jgi:hypothetical protein
VKSTADLGPGAIRLGRDGFERVEDRREVELTSLRRVEEEARAKDRRASVVKHEDDDTRRVLEESPRKDVATPLGALHSQPPTPVNAQVPKLGRRTSESADMGLDTPASPAKRNFALTSAWGGPSGDGDNRHVLDISFGDDQAVDLSDIPMAEDVDVLLASEPLVEKKDELAEFEAKPIVWSGGVR